MKTKTWEEMSLEQEDIYDKDKAMPHWDQFGNKEFLQDMINALRGSPIAIEAWASILQSDSNIASLTLKNGNQEITIGQICDALLSRTEKTKKILDVMWEYSKTMKNNS